jgi:1,4-alpha-glucan branching enzyme
VIEEAPSVQAHVRLADAYLIAGDLAGAGRHFRAASKLAPETKYFAEMAQLIESGAIARPAPEGNVTFRLKGHATAREVFVAGSFNAGHRRQLALTKNGDGVWEVRARVTPGKHTYIFWVDREPVPDPDNPRREEVGGRNMSVMLVE